MIELKNVSKIYESKYGKISAVKDVNLTINKGEIYGIIGYSGAGKSSLIRLLNGLEKPTKGSVIVNGQEVSSISGKELRQARQKISMIFQHFNLLWSRTVKENIAFPLEIAGIPKKDREKRVKELIDLVGLTGRENAYPSQLSGGQKQRVGIARALANNPEVLLGDEATSALDPETTDAILDLLLDINKRLNITIVLITHEMHVIQKICHRVSVMEAGKIVETGDVLEVFQNPQADITKKFVMQVSEMKESKESIQHILSHYKNGKIIKLTYVGKETDQPVISRLIKEFQVEVNIVQGNIKQTAKGAYGTLIVHIDGNQSHIEKVLQFLQMKDIQAEVIEHV